jgi:uncharacterized protein (TIGR03437 family)
MNILKKAPGLFIAAVIIPAAAFAQQYTISTIAGTGGNAVTYGDGTAANSAGVYTPTRVAVDSKGNYYIVQLTSQIIRVVTASSGIITTLAGNGTYGFSGDDGVANQAEVSDVHGIVVDSSGNVYISDTGNSRIRKIDTSGNITTIAGNGTSGYAGDGSSAINAELGRPGALAIDSSGNIYVPDYANSVVRKISSSGNISTIAGTGNFGLSGDGGSATQANLGAPVAVAVDGSGNVYISDTWSASIRKITSDGNIHTVATGVDAENLVVDGAGNLYFPDYLTNTVKKILPNGTKIAIAGNGIAGFAGDGGLATNAELNFPYGIAIDSKNNLYVADTNNQVIRLLTPVTTQLSVVNGASGLNGAFAPGEIVVIYGTGLGPSTVVVNQPVNGVYSTQTAGTSVTFDGTPAPILYSSATQVAAVVPYEEQAGVTSTIALTYQGNTLTATNPTAGAAPGIFTADSSGSGQAAAVNQDGTLNGPAHPARVGNFISLYLTGEGYTAPSGVDGLINSDYNNLPVPVRSSLITINGQKAGYNYIGEAPASVSGLLQINAQIPQIPPAQLINGPVAVPVSVQIAGFPTQTGVTIYVSN